MSKINILDMTTLQSVKENEYGASKCSSYAEAFTG
jgi:hypothetical protein